MKRILPYLLLFLMISCQTTQIEPVAPLLPTAVQIAPSSQSPHPTANLSGTHTPIPGATITPIPTITPPSIQDLTPLAQELSDLPSWLKRAWLINRLGVPLAEVETVLKQTNWSDPWSDFSLTTIDLNGDGEQEWLLNLYQESKNRPYPVGDFWIISQSSVWQLDNEYDRMLLFDGAPDIELLTDLTGDQKPELILSGLSCGAHTCFTHYFVFSYHHGSFENILSATTEKMSQVEIATATFIPPSIDNNSPFPQFMIHSGSVGSAGAGIVRTQTSVWGWDGIAIRQQDTLLDPPMFRFHMLWEANELFDDGALETAALHYIALLEETTLPEDDLFLTDEDSRRFAAFRLLYIGLHTENEGWQTKAQNWFATDKFANPIKEAATQLSGNWATYSDSTSSCREITNFMTQFPDPTGALATMGYAVPNLTAVDLCPAP